MEVRKLFALIAPMNILYFIIVTNIVLLPVNRFLTVHSCRVFPQPKSPVSFGQIKLLEKTQICPRLFKDFGGENFVVGHFGQFKFSKSNSILLQVKIQKPKNFWAKIKFCQKLEKFRSIVVKLVFKILNMALCSKNVIKIYKKCSK